MAYYHKKKVSLNQPHRASGKDAAHHKSLFKPNWSGPRPVAPSTDARAGVVYVKDGPKVKKVLFGDPKWVTRLVNSRGPSNR